MDIFELVRDENDPIYRGMSSDNLQRHYGFLFSTVNAAVALQKPLLSESLIKAFNFHAIVGLHHEAGLYRSHQVTVGQHVPPKHFRVEPLMDDLVNELNWSWQSTDPFVLAAYALWKINFIHPFVNGNGRTARALYYFILCVKLGGLLRGNTILPEMLRQEPIRSSHYVPALQEADEGNSAPLTDLIRYLVSQQVASVPLGARTRSSLSSKQALAQKAPEKIGGFFSC